MLTEMRHPQTLVRHCCFSVMPTVADQGIAAMVHAAPCHYVVDLPAGSGEEAG